MKVIFLMMIGISLLSAELTRDPVTGIVSDSATGLAWLDNNISTTMTWENAIGSCENLTFGGKSDWRLPNINELKSIIDRTKISPAIKDGFENTKIWNYWSSTTKEEHKQYAWYVYNIPGYAAYQLKSKSAYVRCVRNRE